MAKKQEVVEILLKLSDGGTIPILGKKAKKAGKEVDDMGRKAQNTCLLYTSPSPRDATLSRMPSSA